MAQAPTKPRQILPLRTEKFMICSVFRFTGNHCYQSGIFLQEVYSTSHHANLIEVARVATDCSVKVEFSPHSTVASPPVDFTCPCTRQFKAKVQVVKCQVLGDKKTSQKMQEKSTQPSSKLKPLNALIAILLVATLILAALNLRDYFLQEFVEEQTANSKEDVKEAKRPHLKPLRLDVARFEIEVVKPHKDMRAKFPKHPDMVINKLSKLLDKEKNK